MSKIDDYNRAKKEAQIMRDFADKARNSSRYDKFGAKVKITDDYIGCYGNSSTSSWTGFVVQEMEKEIADRLRVIAGLVADRLEKVAETKRKEAADEARAILGQTTESKPS